MDPPLWSVFRSFEAQKMLPSSSHVSYLSMPNDLKPGKEVRSKELAIRPDFENGVMLFDELCQDWTKHTSDAELETTSEGI